jgi:hypothetical protein
VDAAAGKCRLIVTSAFAAVRVRKKRGHPKAAPKLEMGAF